MELNQFSNVALATISIEQNGYVKIRNVHAIKSTKSAKELAPIFAIKDLNHFANNKDVVDNLIVYEIDLFNKDITVIKAACNIGTIRLDS